MLDSEVTLNTLLKAWETLHHGTAPPEQPIKLLTEGSCIAYIEDSWGPMVPYPSVAHGDGRRNYGYRRVKGNKDAVASIPEVRDALEFRDFLLSVNSENSLIESVGCDIGYFAVNDNTIVKSRLGSYTDIICSNYDANRNPVNLLYLASIFMKSVEESEKWWSKVEIGIQKLRGLYNTESPWGVILRVSGNGRTDEEARRSWGVSLRKLSDSVGEINASRLKVS